MKWPASGRSPEIRHADEVDSHAVGVLILEALEDAPSSDQSVNELDDPLAVGIEILVPRTLLGHAVFVAELDGELAGICQVQPREFVRSRHVAEACVIVHPEGRRRGAGDALMAAAEACVQESGVLRKLYCRAAEDDIALNTLLERRGWVVERRERLALRREGNLLDVLAWARHLP